LLELLSGNVGEAYMAVMILYTGGAFVSPFAFFFIADYCEIKLHPLFVRTPMVVLSIANVIVMWTTKFHRLFYTGYDFDVNTVHFLNFVPGPLYSVFHTYLMVCVIAAMGIVFFSSER
jgi:hypothetical protein